MARTREMIEKLGSFGHVKAKGQSMILVAILVGSGVLFGFVALAVDGGSTLLQRRIVQNAADAAAMGAAQMLANNVVYQGRPSPSPPAFYYIVRNQDIVANVDKLLMRNRGSTAGSPIAYTTTIAYRSFNGLSYSYIPVAISYTTAPSQSWDYQQVFTPDGFVGPQYDAVQVDVEMENPMTFARVIGINSMLVQAKSSVALLNVDLDPAHPYVPQGDTWPITANYNRPGPTPMTFEENAGICQPVLFYFKDSNNPNGFQNLLSLAASEGVSFSNGPTPTGTLTPTPQMITAADESSVDNRSHSLRTFTSACNDNGMDNEHWDADGSCSRRGRPHNNICCRTGSPDNDVSDIDVPNWIAHDFKGIISTSTTKWITPPNNRRAVTDPPGDWIETYLGSNHISNPQIDQPNDVIQSLQNYVIAKATEEPSNSTDSLSPQYGLHVDKIMYMYDQGEVWSTVTPTPLPFSSDAPGDTPTETSTTIPTATPTPTFTWRGANAGEEPDRVHMAKVYKFRFYLGMIDHSSINRIPQLSCFASPYMLPFDNVVLAVPIGEVAIKAPLDTKGHLVLSRHGLYNYVTYIDPSP